MSKTKTIPLADASVEQVRDFAENVLGIAGLPRRATLQALLAKMSQAGFEGDSITVFEEAAAGALQRAAEDAPEGALTPGSYMKGEKVTVIIEREDKPGGDRPVFLAVNGVGMLVPRGEPVAIGLPYLEVLENAVQTIYSQNTRTGEIRRSDVPQHPFRVIRQRAA